MKTSTLLMRAKKQLPRHALYPICYTLLGIKCGERESILALETIANRISPNTMAPYWLASKVTGSKNYAALRDWVNDQDPEAIQAWRHAWIDQLIVEFKSKGD